MYGLMSRLRTAPGRRGELAAILAGVGDMPGCRSYRVGLELSDPHALWVTEVWDSVEAHAASLELPGVQATIAAGRPLIAGFDQRIEIEPVEPI
jgi:quinol monooxygenase YgiN